MKERQKKSSKQKDDADLKFEEYAAKQFVELRKNLDLTQPELQDFLENTHGESYDVKTIYRWEKGKSAIPLSVMIRMQMFADEIQAEKKENLGKDILLKNKQTILKRVLAKVAEGINNINQRK